MGSRVTFYGYVKSDEIPIIMNATDIAILPYKRVTESGVLHLYAAYSLPIITSDLDAFREIKMKYDCIETFSLKLGHRDLARKIQMLIFNNDKRKYLIAKCKDMVNETSWANIAKKHLMPYSEILADNTNFT